ncbi:hypothetical protein HK100_003276 [Physocladia obscura]|uniref:Ankyrin repeat protein n=1 Tax=Physocladia obscura TaxID=109957 RepID=A0AAD5SV49_9FUNG|nr:hypothetical protein HK100_003276 [Physocladia obscura]
MKPSEERRMLLLKFQESSVSHGWLEQYSVLSEYLAACKIKLSSPFRFNLLKAAAHGGHLEFFKIILNYPADNVRQIAEALDCALSHNNLSILLNRSKNLEVDFDVKTEFVTFVYCEVSRQGNITAFDNIFSEFPEFTTFDYEDELCFLLAVEHHNFAMALHILLAMREFFTDDQLIDALFKSLNADDVAMAEIILNHSNLPTLFYAAHMDILMSSGQFLPVYLIRSCGHHVFEFFVHKINVSVNLQDKAGNSAVHLSADMHRSINFYPKPQFWPGMDPSFRKRILGEFAASILGKYLSTEDEL